VEGGEEIYFEVVRYDTYIKAGVVHDELTTLE
jgi:hypothetical protein